MGNTRVLHLGRRIASTIVGRLTGSVRPTVFISATSADLGSLRNVVKQALLDQGCHPIEQSHFAPDYRDVEEMLRQRIRTCDALVHLVGIVYGAEPGSRPENALRRSYTQMEYHMARELGIMTFMFLCPEDPSTFPYDSEGEDSTEQRLLQQAHRKAIQCGNILYTDILSEQQLREETLKLYQHLLKNTKGPWVSVLLHWLALAAMLAGIWWGVRELRQALTVDDSPDRILAQAEERMDARAYAEAFHLYARLSDGDPQNLELHRRLQVCAEEGGLLQQLYQRYQEKVKSSPDEPVYHNALGNACLAIDPTDPEDRARRAYERAMGLDPTLSPPLNNLAIIHFRNNDLETAEKLFRAYIGLEPTDAVARINLAELLTREIEADPVNTNRLEVARSALEVARTMNEGSSRVQKLWGRWYEAQDREEEALAAYRRGLALDSDDRFLIQKVERLGWDVESSGGDGMAVRGSADAANKP